jgi:hypothetical protein
MFENFSIEYYEIEDSEFEDSDSDCQILLRVRWALHFRRGKVVVT